MWYTASSCLVLYTALLVFYLLRPQRLFFDPFTLNIKVDSMAMVLLITGIFSRMFRLDSPRNVM
jgi:hypothetical protein